MIDQLLVVFRKDKNNGDVQQRRATAACNGSVQRRRATAACNGGNFFKLRT
ncbi:MAG: hypothetical protein NZM34_05205 [Bernardetiaceae bacterium]|nr:hypothetical protein [Bernardetiaceae bacterium]